MYDNSKQYRLNLGRFNQCVDYLSSEQEADYPIDSGDKIFYYMSEEGDIVSTDLAKFSVCIPTFSVGVTVGVGRVNDSDVIQTLLSHIELKIMAMINRIISEYGGDFRVNNIKIPVKSIQFFDESGRGRTVWYGCYGWAEVGIAIIVPTVELVTKED